MQIKIRRRNRRYCGYRRTIDYLWHDAKTCPVAIISVKDVPIGLGDIKIEQPVHFLDIWVGSEDIGDYGLFLT